MTAASTDTQTSTHTPAGRIPGETGVWVLIFGDLMVFGIIFIYFITCRGSDPALFNTSQATLHRWFGGVNTLLLLTSSLLVVFAVDAIRRGRERQRAQWLLFGALACAALFLTNKGVEWGTLLADGHLPTTNGYYMLFFVMTGLHAAHVVLGAIALCILIAFSRKDSLSKHQYSFVESGACFWHLVDILWLIIFPLLYLMH